MCGENATLQSLLEDMVGSPPHVRGKHGDNPFLKSRYGITPACAGKT